MHQPITHPQIAAVILAAGGSQRMGQPKQLLLVDGQPMLRRVAEAACPARLTQVVVVIGAHSAQMREALAGLPVCVQYNPDWAEGIGTSLRAGIHALNPDVEAALVILADHPGLSTRLIDRLVDGYQHAGAAIVAPAYRGRRGHPVLFAHTLFPELLRLQGDQGARSLLDRPDADLVCIDVDDPAVIQDIDTPDDYAGMVTWEAVRR
jgi:molybdenum cofactor cytidylyltransferase